MRIDPRENPIRGDLAALSLAHQIFAPHYADAITRKAIGATTIRIAASNDSEATVPLARGDAFHVLDYSGGWAWGHSDAPRSVGYVPESMLE